MDERQERLSNFVRELRGPISLRELARRLDLSVGTVESWEKGRSLPGLDNLYRLAAYAGMPADSLVRFLENGELPQPYDVAQIAVRIKFMDCREVAIISQAITDRLAAS